MAYYESMDANLLHVLMTCRWCSTDHFDTWRLHFTTTFVKL